MKKSFCKGCGGILNPGVKVCPHCGRLVTQQDGHTYDNGFAGQRTNGGMPVRKRQYQRPPVSEVYESESGTRPKKHPRKRHRTRIAIRIITAAFVIAAVYFATFFVQVTRVKLSSYDFDSQMTMSRSNYGQAISNYFDEGHWSYNPFTLKCTYKGTSEHKEEYEIEFSVRISVEVTSLKIDGKEYKNEAIESRMMGLFI